MSPSPPPRRPVGHEGVSRPAVLPDRTREVSAAPELDGAVSSLMDLARWAKARRHRGPLTLQEEKTVEVALQRRTGAFSSAVRRMLRSPAARRPATGASTGPSTPAPAPSGAPSRTARAAGPAQDEAVSDEGSAEG